MPRCKLKFNITDCPKCEGSGTVSVVEPGSLREARVEAGVGLNELARRLDLSGPYLSDIEHGRRNCTERIKEAYIKL